MKRKIKIISISIIAFCVGFLGYKIKNKLNQKKEVSERIQVIPNFSFLSTKGIEFTVKNLDSKPTIFIYFNSDCDYCKSEATKIQERLSEFKDTQLIFVSFEKRVSIEKFAKQYKLNNQGNVIFLEDKKGEFSKLFNVNSIPYIVIYDKNKKFIQKFKGITKIDKILKTIKQ
jgi:peroxiredoxin